MIVLAPGSSLIVASHNRGKIREIKDLLSPFGFGIRSAAELGFVEPEETGTSFAANALIKARNAARSSHLPSLSDDSGLCVGALDGAPGIFSARWAGSEKDFRIAIQRVERELDGNPDRRAYFVCVLALALPGGEEETFEGRAYGALTFPPRGEHGFGYDPIFVPEGHRFTFGEMDPAIKHAISHRAKALKKFTNSFKAEQS